MNKGSKGSKGIWGYNDNKIQIRMGDVGLTRVWFWFYMAVCIYSFEGVKVEKGFAELEMVMQMQMVIKMEMVMEMGLHLARSGMVWCGMVWYDMMWEWFGDDVYG